MIKYHKGQRFNINPDLQKLMIAYIKASGDFGSSYWLNKNNLNAIAFVLMDLIGDPVTLRQNYGNGLNPYWSMFNTKTDVAIYESVLDISEPIAVKSPVVKEISFVNGEVQ